MTEDVMVDGTPLCASYNLILQSCTETEPEPKVCVVDVPGGDGSVDLTEALLGDVAYTNRSFEFGLASVSSRAGFAKKMTSLRSFLHGKRFDFTLSWDTGYTYTGRFAVKESIRAAKTAGLVTVIVSANPYKFRETYTYRINAAGGVTVQLPCGRRHVCPIIEVNSRALVSYGGVSWTLEPGASRIRDLWLSQEHNALTIDTYQHYCVAYWTDYTGKRWSDLAGKRWSDIGSASKPLQASPAWAAYTGKRWSDLAGKRWVELMHPAKPDDEYAAYIQYNWEDL